MKDVYLVMQERLDSSGRGMNEYSAHDRPDEQDGPAPPGAPPPGPGSDDPGARLRRALSRNTLLPQDIPSTSSKSNTSGSQAASASAGACVGAISA